MPIAHVNEIDIYYEIHGEGPNLTLIEGIGFHTWMWYRQIPAFAPHFRTLVYDNRGVGRTDKPPGPYTHEQNAADLAALLDFLGWDRTHVLGVSMGGFIAQQFALDYPERLNKLVLACTAPGGPSAVPVTPEALAAIMPNPDMTPEEQIRAAAAVSYANPHWPQEHREEYEQILRWRLELPQPPEARVAQAMAALTFRTEERLHEIQAPTLVITGSEDKVVPPRNAALLVAAIPHAELDIIPNAGHHVFYEQADRFNHDVLAFLEN